MTKAQIGCEAAAMLSGLMSGYQIRRENEASVFGVLLMLAFTYCALSS